MSERYSRNEALFGAQGQAKIASTRVLVVGLGGLGAPVAQQLGYLGIETYALIDFDIVTESSLNRLVGATDADVAAGSPKVVVAQRTIRAVKPTAEIVTVQQPLTAPDAVAAIAASDIVFGCVDHDRARIELTEICSRFAKPYFDLASDTLGSRMRSTGVASCSATARVAWCASPIYWIRANWVSTGSVTSIGWPIAEFTGLIERRSGELDLRWCRLMPWSRLSPSPSSWSW